VHLAPQSGIQASIIVHTILKKPANAELAKQFYQKRIAERVKRYAGKTRTEYSRVSSGRPESFWNERGRDTTATESHGVPQLLESPPPFPAMRVTVSPDARIEEEPVIDGAFVEKRRVLKHPCVEGSIAYIDGVQLVTLLSALPREIAYENIEDHWREYIPVAVGRKIASWLWNKRILVEGARPESHP
jgi:hypothetical protein